MEPALVDLPLQTVFTRLLMVSHNAAVDEDLKGHLEPLIAKLEDKLHVNDQIELWLKSPDRETRVVLDFVRFRHLLYSLLNGRTQEKYKCISGETQISMGLRALTRNSSTTPKNTYEVAAAVLLFPLEAQTNVPLLFLWDALNEMENRNECTPISDFSGTCSNVDSKHLSSLPGWVHLPLQLALEEIILNLEDSDYSLFMSPHGNRLRDLASVIHPTSRVEIKFRSNFKAGPSRPTTLSQDEFRELLRAVEKDDIGNHKPFDGRAFNGYSLEVLDDNQRLAFARCDFPDGLLDDEALFYIHVQKASTREDGGDHARPRYNGERRPHEGDSHSYRKPPREHTRTKDSSGPYRYSYEYRVEPDSESESEIESDEDDGDDNPCYSDDGFEESREPQHSRGYPPKDKSFKSFNPRSFRHPTHTDEVPPRRYTTYVYPKDSSHREYVRPESDDRRRGKEGDSHRYRQFPRKHTRTRDSSDYPPKEKSFNRSFRHPTHTDEVPPRRSTTYVYPTYGFQREHVRPKSPPRRDTHRVLADTAFDYGRTSAKKQPSHRRRRTTYYTYRDGAGCAPRSTTQPQYPFGYYSGCHSWFPRMHHPSPGPRVYSAPAGRSSGYDYWSRQPPRQPHSRRYF